MQAMTAAIERRLEVSGAGGGKVRPLGQDQFEILLPGVDAQELERIKKLIAAIGVLEFRLLAAPGIDDELIAASQPNAGNDPAQDQNSVQGRWVRVENPNNFNLSNDVQRETADGGVEVLVVEDGLGLKGSHLAEVQATHDDRKSPAIDGTLTQRSGALMKQLTSANLPNPQTGTSRRLGIIFDDQLLTAPTIQSTIELRFQVTGNFPQEEVDFLVAVLRAGRLPAKLKSEPVSVTEVQPAR